MGRGISDGSDDYQVFDFASGGLGLTIATSTKTATFAGPIWATPVKPGIPALGLVGLAELCESVAAPVIAIGGVDATNAALCLEAGAVGVAVVRASTDAAAVRTALERAAV